MRFCYYIIYLLTMIFISAPPGSYALDFGSQTAKQIRYPNYDTQGQLKFEVQGDEAQALADGQIRIINLRLVFYEEGKVIMEVTSPECLLDRNKQTATSAALVRVIRPEMILTGKGYLFTWDNDQGRLDILSQAKVVLQRDLS